MFAKEIIFTRALFFPTEFLNVTIKRQNMCSTNMCVPRDSSKRFLNVDFMEESEVKLISQSLGKKLRFGNAFPD